MVIQGRAGQEPLSRAYIGPQPHRWGQSGRPIMAINLYKVHRGLLGFIHRVGKDGLVL